MFTNRICFIFIKKISFKTVSIFFCHKMISQSICENKVFYNENETCHISYVRSVNLLGNVKSFIEILVTKNNKQIFYIDSDNNFCDLMIPNKVIIEYIMNEIRNINNMIDLLQKLIILSKHSDGPALLGAYYAVPFSFEKIVNDDVKLEDWAFSKWDDHYFIHLPSSNNKTICFNVFKSIHKATLCLAGRDTYQLSGDSNYEQIFKVSNVNDVYSYIGYVTPLNEDMVLDDDCFELDNGKSVLAYLENYCNEKKLDYYEVSKFVSSMLYYYSRVSRDVSSFNEVKESNLEHKELKQYAETIVYLSITQYRI